MKASHILLLLAVAASANAAMYKWKDAQGNVHYTETPPPTGDAKEIAPPPRVTPPAASTSKKDTATSEDNDGEAADKEQEPKLSPEEQAAYTRNCEAARANLQIYQTKGRIKTPDGEIVDLNDDVRQKKIQQAEEQIKKFCK